MQQVGADSLVFYSLGDLVFDWTHDERTQESAVADLTFVGARLVQVDLHPIFIIDGQPNLLDSSAGGAGVSAAASAAGESEVAVDRVSATGAKASRAASAAGGGVACLLEPQPISQTASNSATVRMRYSIPRGITPWWVGSVKQRGGGDDRRWRRATFPGCLRAPSR